MKPAATTPNLVWSKTVVDLIEKLPSHVRESFEYLGPANSVLHVALPGVGGTNVSRALYRSKSRSCSQHGTRSSRFASGAHKRIRLKNSAGQSVVMNFDCNTIHAGCNTPPTAVSSAFSYLLYSHRNNRAELYKQGYSLNVPNIVISARTSFPVSRDTLKRMTWTNYSEKFPGFAVIHPKLMNNICPELYPSRETPPKHMNLVIPGISDAARDLPPTLILLAELLNECRYTE